MAAKCKGNICNILFLFCVVLIFSVGSYICVLFRVKYRQIPHKETLRNGNFTDGNVTKILIWGATKHGAMFGYGKEAFSRRCKMDTCALTDDMQDFTTARAVLFYVKNVLDNFEIPSNAPVKRLPKAPGYPVRVSREQIFVFFHVESPGWRHAKDLHFHRLGDIFNVTMTYLEHPDTDIFVHRGVPKPRVLPEDELLHAVKNKTKMVAWVVSNCKNPASSRDRYAAELRKYVDVDIYGKCGIPCNDTWLGMDCFHMIEKQYKFYLAFENSFCVDYVTEKMYRTLNLNLVPIALNGANNSKLLPSHSYIDVRDFRSPRHLAEYLNELDSNHTRYMEYFAWRKTYVRRTYPQPFCELCRILHNETHRYKDNFEPNVYWNATKYCHTREEEYAAVGLL